MHPYGIVVFPRNRPLILQARAFENGIFARAHDDDDCQAGVDFPLATFYQTEAGRDAELVELLQLYPGTMFCPITITAGKMTQPSPKPSEFTISERGVLPA